MFETLPQDPVILLGVINTKLRDYYKTLDEMCEDMELDKDTLVKKLREIDYEYEEQENQFI